LAEDPEGLIEEISLGRDGHYWHDKECRRRGARQSALDARGLVVGEACSD
jgi:hypothetical protein